MRLRANPDGDHGSDSILGMTAARREEVSNVLWNGGFVLAGASVLGYMGQVMHIIPNNDTFFLWTGGIGLLVGATLRK